MNHEVIIHSFESTLDSTGAEARGVCVDSDLDSGRLVEITGIEPVTSGLQSRRSPN